MKDREEITMGIQRELANEKRRNKLKELSNTKIDGIRMHYKINSNYKI